MPLVLPDAFFEIEDALKQQLTDHELAAATREQARLHAVVAVERFINMANAVGDFAMLIALLRQGVPHLLPRWNQALIANIEGITALLRQIDVTCAPSDLPAAFTPELQQRALLALRRVNERSDLIALLEDARLGWREFTVVGTQVRAYRSDPGALERLIELSVLSEAERNAALMENSAKASEHDDFYRELIRRGHAARGGAAVAPLVVEELVLRGEEIMRKSGDLLGHWRMPSGLMVAEQFAIGEYRRVVDLLRGLATVHQVIAYNAKATDERLVHRRDRTELQTWIAAVTGIEAPRVSSLLDFLTYRSSDAPAGSTEPPLAATPLIDVGGGEIVIVPNVMVRQGAEAALRQIWARRAPQDFGARAAELNHAHAEAVSAVFAEKGWFSCTEKQIEGVGDIDAGCAITTDDYFVTVEAKVFVRDPLEKAHEREVQTQLGKVMEHLSSQVQFDALFATDGLVHGEVAGLIVLPGRAVSQVDLGSGVSITGLDDVREAVAASASPREMFALLKKSERRSTLSITNTTRVFDPWSIEYDAVSFQSLPNVLRLPAADP